MTTPLAAGVRVSFTFPDFTTGHGFIFPRRTGKIVMEPGSEAWAEKPEPRGPRDQLGHYLVQAAEGRDRLDRHGYWNWLCHESELEVVGEDATDSVAAST